MTDSGALRSGSGLDYRSIRVYRTQECDYKSSRTCCVGPPRLNGADAGRVGCVAPVQRFVRSCRPRGRPSRSRLTPRSCRNTIDGEAVVRLMRTHLIVNGMSQWRMVTLRDSNAVVVPRPERAGADYRPRRVGNRDLRARHWVGRRAADITRAHSAGVPAAGSNVVRRESGQRRKAM